MTGVRWAFSSNWKGLGRWETTITIFMFFFSIKKEEQTAKIEKHRIKAIVMNITYEPNASASCSFSMYMYICMYI